MFWIILIGLVIVLVIILCVYTHDIDFLVIIPAIAFILLLLSLAISLVYDNEEVVFKYEEQLGTMYTKQYSDNEFIYTLQDGSHKIAPFQNVKIEKANGNYFIKYTVIRSYNKGNFFKWNLSNKSESIGIVMR